MLAFCETSKERNSKMQEKFNALMLILTMSWCPVPCARVKPESTFVLILIVIVAH